MCNKGKNIAIMMLSSLLSILGCSESSGWREEGDRAFDNRNLYFENYENGSEKAPVELSQLRPRDTSKKLLFKKDELKHCEVYPIITGALRDSLIQNKFIFYWKRVEDTMMTFEYHVKMISDGYIFRYIGDLKINKNYRSLLIMSCSKDNSDGFISRDLFLMNVKDNYFLSIIKLSNYYSFQGHAGIANTMRISDNRFEQRSEILSSDDIDHTGYYDEMIRYAEFYIDKNGHIIRPERNTYYAE